MIDVSDLRAALRPEVPPPARTVGERLAAAGKVQRIGADDGGEHLAVLVGAQRFEVWLWPGDAEWECDCDADAGCAHAWAATLALAQGDLPAAEAPPRPVALLRSAGRYLDLSWGVLRGERVDPTPGFPVGVPLPDTVVHLKKLARDWAQDRVPARQYRIVLGALSELEDVRLDGRPIRVKKSGLDPVAWVEPVGAGFRLELRDPPEVEAIFEGDPTLLLCDGFLQPRGRARLSEVQQHQLRQPLLFSASEQVRLVAEWLPALEKAGLRVVRGEGVPEVRHAGLHTVLSLRRHGHTLEAVARIVYGDPPLAEVRGAELVPLGGATALPARDRGREADLEQRLVQEIGLRPGQWLRLQDDDAARWVQERLPRFRGTTEGDADFFAVRGPGLRAEVDWGPQGLRMRFTDGHAVVAADRVLAAWHAGRTMVALPDGGFSPLPSDWLGEHAPLVDAALASPVGQAAAAARLFEATGAPPPPDLLGLIDALSPDAPDLPVPDGLRATLRAYQARGASWMRRLADARLGAVLADDMGLGKTVQALALLLARRHEGPALVVAPTSMLRTWADEAARFAPELRVEVLHGAGREAALQRLRDGGADVGVTSYALLRLDQQALGAVRFATAILDEAQAIKNDAAQVSRAAHGLDAAFRVALTGTPVENRPAELWSLFEFALPGFFGPKARFDERLGRPAMDGDPRALSALRARIRPFVLRRLKTEVAPELPPRTETVVRCAMTDGQRRAYDGIKHATGALAGADRMTILAALLRLRQAACDPALLPGGDPAAGSGKLDRLMEQLDELVAEGGRALVFSQWTSLLDRVQARLGAAGIDWLRLDGSTVDRAAVVAGFQSDQGPPVMLLSLQAGGTGLTLTAADHVFLLDPWWNPAAERQATDRAHRIGQDKPVFIWKLVSEGTVEEAILGLQARKAALADAVVEGQDGGAALGADELLALVEGA